MKKTLSVIQILFSLIAGICYPLMLKEGVFDGNWYGVIGAAVAIYGGLIGGLIHFIKKYH